jgi:oxygen-dependent protoporphyrinogen oxidase
VRIAVIGGGISGLAAATFLEQAGHDVVCIEPAAPGGLVRSERIDGYLCETGPQALLDGPADTRALIAAAGLEARVAHAAPAARRRFIHARGQLHALPMSPFALARSSLFGWRGKLRLLAEPFVRRARPAKDAAAAAGDESVLEFGARRFGDEAARALVAPAVIGIYAGDAAALSAQSALPRLVAFERQHGSVIRGALAGRRAGGGMGRAISFPDGLQELPRALAARLGDHLVTARVGAIARATGGGSGGWRVSLDGGAAPISADAVVVAAGPAASAALIEPFAPAAAGAIRAVRLAPAAVVALGFRDADLGVDLGGYGFLVAHGAGDGNDDAAILGCQYETSVFPRRAPEGAVLLRAIMGGTFLPGVVDLPDDALIARAVSDLGRLAGLRRAPDMARAWRHPAAIPQYARGHAALVAAADADLARTPGLHLLGHALHGLGLGDCIAAAAALARALPRHSARQGA